MSAKTCYAICNSATRYTYVFLVRSTRRLHSASLGIRSELYSIGVCVYLCVFF